MEDKTQETKATELKALIYDQIVILDNYRRAAVEKQNQISALEQQLGKLITPSLEVVKGSVQ